MSYNGIYMERAIELASRGVGAVNPNPLVGAVIVKDDCIMGEGYHAKYGELHAERQAIADAIKRGNNIYGAEMYVTLEPCSHTGKQPPCVEAIIDAGIKRVYVGSNDPNPLVAGNGIWALRQAGVEVVTGCMKEECDKLNYVFFHFITKKVPYVIYKYAMTMDGKICTGTGESQWISNESSRNIVQAYRNEFSAIMVGIGTVLNDDPSLLCHLNDKPVKAEGEKNEESENDSKETKFDPEMELIDGSGINSSESANESSEEDSVIGDSKQMYRNPIRIILDSELRIPLDSKIVQTADKARTYIASLAENEKQNREKIRELKNLGIGTLLIPADETGKIGLDKLMLQLGKMNIDGVLLEGGGTLAWSMINKGYVDEVRAFIAPKIFGGANAKTPVAGEGIQSIDMAKYFELKDLENIDGDIFARYIKQENHTV